MTPRSAAAVRLHRGWGGQPSKRPIWHATQRNSTSTPSYSKATISMPNGSLYVLDQCGAYTLSLHARRFMLGRYSSRTWRYRNLPCMTIVQRHVDRSAMFLRRRVPSRSHETCAISTRRAEGVRAPCSGPAKRAYLPASKTSLHITAVKSGCPPRSPSEVRPL